MLSVYRQPGWQAWDDAAFRALGTRHVMGFAMSAAMWVAIGAAIF